MYDPDIHDHNYRAVNASTQFDAPVERPHVTIYSDGSYKPAINYGGYGTLMKCSEHAMMIYGGSAADSNNRMELTAVLTALRKLTQPCEVVVVSDSEYVIRGLNGYLWGWASNDWLNSKRQPIANSDLWQEMLGFCQYHHITGQWVKGHMGHPENERCDRLATIGAYEAANLLPPQSKNDLYQLQRGKFPGWQDDETLPNDRIPDKFGKF